MDGKGFQVWLSAARGLTRAQRREALAVLSGRSEGEASKAAIELGVDEARRCPHCASEGAVSRGMARGLRRYQMYFVYTTSEHIRVLTRHFDGLIRGGGPERNVASVQPPDVATFLRDLRRKV